MSRADACIRWQKGVEREADAQSFTPSPSLSPRLQADSQDNARRGGEEQTQAGVAPPTIGCTQGGLL